MNIFQRIRLAGKLLLSQATGKDILSNRDRIEIKHILGRTNSAVVVEEFYPTHKSWDETRPDYVWWDNFRRGRQEGFEASGNQAQAIAETVTSYVIGRGVSVSLEKIEDKRLQAKEKYTNGLLRRLFTSLQGFLIMLYQDLYALGDQYVIVNSDGSFTVPPPDSVYPQRDDMTQELTGYKIVTRTDGWTITDEYTAKRRTVTFEGTDENGTPKKIVKQFPVLIGRIPVVHFKNDATPQERYGRPGYASLLPLWSDYNDMLIKGAQGSKVAGNPVPVFEGLENPEETIDLNAGPEETYIDERGEERKQRRIYWDRLAAIVLGKGGTFRFASPATGFSTDIENVINLTFKVIQNRTHIPDHVLGGSEGITGEAATAKTPPWVRYIEGRRDLFAGNIEDDDLGIDAAGGLQELVQVWLKTRSLYDKKIIVGPTVIQWSDLTGEDQKIKFEKVKFAHSRGMITGETALRILDLVEDPTTEYRMGQAELKTRLLVEPEGDDFTGGKLKEDGSQDNRTDGGSSARKPRPKADTPRGPAYGGGGKRT